MRVSGATGVRDHNVILTRRGPVVTDWCNAGAGDPAADVAMTMVTVSSADVPGLAARLGRELLLRGIRGGCRTDPAGRIQEAVRAKLDDPNLTPTEAAWLRRHAGVGKGPGVGWTDRSSC
jgi:aminoglycoside phosphotransferase (APT) family kinase protein